MKRISIYASAAIFSGILLFTGCGDGGSNSEGSSSSAPSTPSTSTSSSSMVTKSVRVIDGYVIGATVRDCKGTTALTDAHGVATAAFDPECPLESQGGTIDANDNGIADDNEIPALTMHAPAGSSVISNITELIQAGANASKLAAILGVSEAELYSDPIAENNIVIAKANQVLYAVEISGKTAEFVELINNYGSSSSNTSTTSSSSSSTTSSSSSSTGDLPTIGHYGSSSSNTSTTSSSSSSTTSSSSSSTGDLPTIGHYKSLVRGELPGFSYDDSSSSVPSSNNSSSSVSNSSDNADISRLASLAKSLFEANSLQVSFIDALLALDVNNAQEIESAIFTIKKELYESVISESSSGTSETSSSSATCLPGQSC